MTRFTSHSLVLAMCLTLPTACSPGESAEAPDAVTGAAVRSPTVVAVGSGTLVDVALSDEINSRRALAGDAFTAVVVDDVVNGEGTVVIPAGSVVDGTVTEVSPASSTRSTGTLTLVVSSVTIRGTSYDFDTAIDGLETVHEERGIEQADVARVVGGAAAGAIVGRVIGGNTKGTVIGGAVGAVTGTAVSVAVKDMDIVLPAGAHLVLRLTRPFSTTS